MNKTITIAASVIAGVALPFLGMTITPTRDLILGMAPDEAVLTLADKIDEQRVSVDQAKIDSDAKLAEFQSTIDAQQAKLAEQQQLIDSQNVKVEVANTAIQTTNETVARQKDCSADVNKYCNGIVWQNKDAFDKSFNSIKENHPPYFDDNELKTELDGMTEHFNNCQQALKCN